ncbi:MAG: acyl carrier protein [Burkholderiaceae bacterium]|nr:acyl carrier protein [Burkholderiaceae bacterium]
MPTLRARLIELLSDTLQIELSSDVIEVRRDDFDDWDSVNHLRLIMDVEEAFGISLDEEQAAMVSSLDALETLVRAALREAAREGGG